MGQMKNIIFSDYLKLIYPCLRKDLFNTQASFVASLFSSVGSNYFETNESDELCRKVFSGGRNISIGMIESIPKKHKKYELIKFFKTSIDKSRIEDVLQSFDIKTDMTKDFDILCEALSLQFFNYIQFKGYTNTSIYSLYTTLYNQKQNKKYPNANEQAIYDSLEMFCYALSYLKKLDGCTSIAENKDYIENYINGINKVFRSFEYKCDFEGKIIYNEIRNKTILKNKNSSNYLKMISELGSIPVKLSKKVQITIYVNETSRINYDKIFDLTNDYTLNNLKEAVKKYSTKNSEKLYFSENIKFYLTDYEDIGDINSIEFIVSIFAFLTKLKESFKNTEMINKKYIMCKELFSNIQCSNNISFTTDGTYYVKKDEIVFDMSIEMQLVKNNGIVTQTGDDLIDYRKLLFVTSNKFEGIFNDFYNNSLFIASQYKNLEQMSEILIINKDLKCRYYMIPPVSKTKLIRKSFEISETIKNENPIIMLFQGAFKFEKEEFMCVFGFYKDKYYSRTISKEDLIKNKYQTDNLGAQPPKFLSIIANIIKNTKFDEGILENIKK